MMGEVEVEVEVEVEAVKGCSCKCWSVEGASDDAGPLIMHCSAA